MSLTEEQRTPPKRAQQNAAKAIEWREKYPKETEGAGTPIGWRRASQLASGEPVSEDVIKRMAQFNRHRDNAVVAPEFENEPWRDNGYLMWMAWGGTEGIDWALRMSERIDKDKAGAHSMEMKKLVVPFSVKQMDDSDDDFYTFEGYASTFGNVDLGADRVMSGAFKACIEKMKREGKQTPVLWQHDSSMPLGVYIEIEEDSSGLFVKGRMPKGDTFVSGRVIPQMKAGSVSAMSIGYCAIQWEMDGSVRNLKELMLYEISLVTMPMNPSAKITGMKSVVQFQDLPLADTNMSWDSTSAVERVRELTDSMEDPSDAYRRAFLWFDSENAEEFGAYKLPIADVVDGRMLAVPRAIFAAAAAVQGARGGLNVPEGDIDGIKAHINRYYSKMDRESPFGEKGILIVDVDMLKSLTERELDNVLRSEIKVTRSASKLLIKCLDVQTLREAGDGVARDAKSGVKISAETTLKLEQLLKSMRS